MVHVDTNLLTGASAEERATAARRAAWDGVTTLTLLITVNTSLAAYWIITALKMHLAQKSIPTGWNVMRYMVTVGEFTRANIEMCICYTRMMEYVITKRDYMEKVSAIVVMTLLRTGGHHVAMIVGEVLSSESVTGAIVPLNGLLGIFLFIRSIAEGTYVCSGHFCGRLLLAVEWDLNFLTWVSNTS